MSPMTTRAPSSTNRLTDARPMPEHPPVTTATLPSRRPAMVLPPDRGGFETLAGARSSTTVVPVVEEGAPAPVSKPRGSLLVGDEHVLLLGERVRCVGAELAAEAGLLVAPERRPVAHRGVAVHAEVAGLDATRDPQRPPEVVRVDRPGEPVLGVVGQGDRFLLVVEG